MIRWCDDGQHAWVHVHSAPDSSSYLAKHLSGNHVVFADRLFAIWTTCVTVCPRFPGFARLSEAQLLCLQPSFSQDDNREESKLGAKQYFNQMMQQPHFVQTKIVTKWNRHALTLHNFCRILPIWS